MGYMRAYGCIWVYMGVCLGIWVYMGVYRVCGCIGAHMGAYGCIWVHMGVYECIWVFMNVYVCIWVYMVAFGCIWLTWVLYFICPIVATSCFTLLMYLREALVKDNSNRRVKNLMGQSNATVVYECH